jgi:ABC-2 type transport system ATP-binding protein
MLEIRQLSKRFGTTAALDNVSLQVKPGGIGAVVGPNGAGKSTLLRIVAGVLAPSAGQVFVGGMDTRTQGNQVRRLIGFLPEQCPLYRDLRVEEHLIYRGRLKGLAGKRLRARLRSVIEGCGLDDIRRRLTGRLSLGQRQRVGLADVMLTEPRLMVLDEPFAGLDADQADRFCDLLAGVCARHGTVLLATHRLDLVGRLCSSCTTLTQGRVIRQTPPVGPHTDDERERLACGPEWTPATADIGGGAG